MDPSRDLAQVADLIDAAFGDEIDEEGRRVLQEMRAMSRAGPFLWLLSRTSLEFQETFGGYVWVEEGRVVGNVTLNRLTPGGHRWQISNVAVAAAHRRRGIARRLMTCSLEHARAQGGDWVLLQVRADNAPAISLYKDLGFETLGGETYMAWEGTLPLRLETLADAGLPSGYALREIQPNEWPTEMALARAAMPPLMQWEQPVRSQHFRRSSVPGWWAFLTRRLSGREVRRLGVFDAEGELMARLELRLKHRRRQAELRVLVAQRGRGLAERPLLRAGLAFLPDQGPFGAEARFPADLNEVREALLEAGFGEKRTLVHMRLRLETWNHR
ncbi:MAG: GNAT family N-acetyltransferase [Anaerolineae bacterium]